MGILKQAFKNWKKHQQINNFTNEIEVGFNYMENRYNPRNYIEIYRSTEDKYKIEEYSSKKLVKTYEAKDNNDFKEVYDISTLDDIYSLNDKIIEMMIQ